MLEHDFSRVAREKGAHLRAALRAIHSDKIVEVRGMGMLLGVQFPPEVSARDVSRAMLARGFVVGTASGNVLRIAPPLVISDEEMDAFVAALAEELK